MKIHLTEFVANFKHPDAVELARKTHPNLLSLVFVTFAACTPDDRVHFHGELCVLESDGQQRFGLFEVYRESKRRNNRGDLVEVVSVVKPGATRDELRRLAEREVRLRYGDRLRLPPVVC